MILHENCFEFLSGGFAVRSKPMDLGHDDFRNCPQVFKLGFRIDIVEIGWLELMIHACSKFR